MLNDLISGLPGLSRNLLLWHGDVVSGPPCYRSRVTPNGDKRGRLKRATISASPQDAHGILFNVRVGRKNRHPMHDGPGQPAYDRTDPSGVQAASLRGERTL